VIARYSLLARPKSVVNAAHNNLRKEHPGEQRKVYWPGCAQATISVAVLEDSGKLVMECLLKTKAATILQFLAGLRGTLFVTFEEGTSPPGSTIC